MELTEEQKYVVLMVSCLYCDVMDDIEIIKAGDTTISYETTLEFVLDTLKLILALHGIDNPRYVEEVDG